METNTINNNIFNIILQEIKINITWPISITSKVIIGKDIIITPFLIMDSMDSHQMRTNILLLTNTELMSNVIGSMEGIRDENSEEKEIESQDGINRSRNRLNHTLNLTHLRLNNREDGLLRLLRHINRLLHREETIIALNLHHHLIPSQIEEIMVEGHLLEVIEMIREQDIPMLQGERKEIMNTLKDNLLGSAKHLETQEHLLGIIEITEISRENTLETLEILGRRGRREKREKREILVIRLHGSLEMQEIQGKREILEILEDLETTIRMKEEAKTLPFSLDHLLPSRDKITLPINNHNHNNININLMVIETAILGTMVTPDLGKMFLRREIIAMKTPEDREDMILGIITILEVNTVLLMTNTTRIKDVNRDKERDKITENQTIQKQSANDTNEPPNNGQKKVKTSLLSIRMYNLYILQQLKRGKGQFWLDFSFRHFFSFQLQSCFIEDAYHS